MLRAPGSVPPAHPYLCSPVSVPPRKCQASKSVEKCSNRNTQIMTLEKLRAAEHFRPHPVSIAFKHIITDENCKHGPRRPSLYFSDLSCTHGTSTYPNVGAQPFQAPPHPQTALSKMEWAFPFTGRCHVPSREYEKTKANLPPPTYYLLLTTYYLPTT